jgi:hypothetical protein
MDVTNVKTCQPSSPCASLQRRGLALFLLADAIGIALAIAVAALLRA